MKIRRFSAATVLSAALACAPVFGQAPAYPVKPVHIVIPYPPGGSVDVFARSIANELSRLWGQPVVIDGKPGAGGVTAASGVAHSAPDGYTIFMTDQGPLTIIPFLQRDLPYDPIKDFAAVIGLTQSSGIVVVPSNSPVNTIADLIAAAKTRPGAINYGTWGVASTPHLAAAQFAASAGIEMTHVPYKGAVDMTRALMNGEIQLAFHSVNATVPQIKQGQIKAIAYAGQKRLPLLPDVPTVAESGLPGFYVPSWLGFVVPSATPRTIIDRIAADTGRVLSVQAFKEKRIDAAGYELINLSPVQFAQLIDETRARHEVLLKRLKLQAR